MRYMTIANTDTGILRPINQDSVLIKHALYPGGEIVMAIICDGMGGLSRGELASAWTAEAFSEWFDEALPYELTDPDPVALGKEWVSLLQTINQRMIDYAEGRHLPSMGTTFSGILFIGDRYLLVHVGDSRIYHIGEDEIAQLTTDQTFVARAVQNRTMTCEQAEHDKRRNLLLQCIGASHEVEPEVHTGRAERGTYMLCSDGFRHKITEAEMLEHLNPKALPNRNAMHTNARYLIDLVKHRGEKDNISVSLVKAE